MNWKKLVTPDDDTFKKNQREFSSYNQYDTNVQGGSNILVEDSVVSSRDGVREFQIKQETSAGHKNKESGDINGASELLDCTSSQVRSWMKTSGNLDFYNEQHKKFFQRAVKKY